MHGATAGVHVTFYDFFPITERNVENVRCVWAGTVSSFLFIVTVNAFCCSF